MAKHKTFITRSKRGHYTVTVKEQRSSNYKAYWANVHKIQKLSSWDAAYDEGQAFLKTVTA